MCVCVGPLPIGTTRQDHDSMSGEDIRPVGVGVGVCSKCSPWVKLSFYFSPRPTERDHNNNCGGTGISHATQRLPRVHVRFKLQGPSSFEMK